MELVTSDVVVVVVGVLLTCEVFEQFGGGGGGVDAVGDVVWDKLGLCELYVGV